MKGKPCKRLLSVLGWQLLEGPSRARCKTESGPHRTRGGFLVEEWAQSDLNRRPPGYQPGAPANLSYGPVYPRQ